jgi:hypothetical protein
MSHGERATAVHSKAGAFKEDFDEGYFYRLDDFLSLHAAGKKFKDFKDKVKAVKKLGHAVVKNARDEFGVNVSTLPQMAAYKYKAGDKESFETVKIDELDDADEAAEFLEGSIAGSGLQESIIGSTSAGDLDKVSASGSSSSPPSPRGV